MVTVYRSGRLRVIIFVDDHEPAHVHVFGDGHAKIDRAASGAGPRLVWAVGMNRGEIRRAMRLVAEQRDLLLARWTEIHG